MNLIDFLRKLPYKYQIGIIHVTHDPLEACLLAERLYMLENGVIRFSGTWKEFLRDAPGELGRKYSLLGKTYLNAVK